MSAQSRSRVTLEEEHTQEGLRKEYSYFPGCSLHSTGLEYGLSAIAVFKHLGLKLIELPDWNCCGASSAHALDHALALGLPARNLALAQAAGLDLAIPCAACYNRTKNVDYAMRTNMDIRAEFEAIINFTYTGAVAIRPLLAVLYEDCGLLRIAENVHRPLTGLKIVPYYGCLLLRPPDIVQFDDAENPHVMGDLLTAVGAEVKSWSYASDCCGGSLSLSRPDLVTGMVSRLVERAREAGAVALVTACPLCQMNLEMRQPGGSNRRHTDTRMPAFYFTELIGLAFGLPEADAWWGKHLIDPRPVLVSAGLIG